MLYEYTDPLETGNTPVCGQRLGTNYRRIYIAMYELAHTLKNYVVTNLFLFI